MVLDVRAVSAAAVVIEAATGARDAPVEAAAAVRVAITRVDQGEITPMVVRVAVLEMVPIDRTESSIDIREAKRRELFFIDKFSFVLVTEDPYFVFLLQVFQGLSKMALKFQ